jgi:hypothetical protein
MPATKNLGKEHLDSEFPFLPVVMLDSQSLKQIDTHSLLAGRDLLHVTNTVNKAILLAQKNYM